MTMTAPGTGAGARKHNRRLAVGLCVAGLAVAVPVGVVGWGLSHQTEVNGALSVVSGGSGAVQLNMTLCSGKVDRVELYDQRLHPADRSEPDAPVGIWERTSPSVVDTSLVFGNPGPEWEVVLDPGPLDTGATYDALAWSESEGTELAQVDFDPGRVAELPAGTSFLYNSTTVRTDEIRSTVCG